MPFLYLKLYIMSEIVFYKMPKTDIIAQKSTDNVKISTQSMRRL